MRPLSDPHRDRTVRDSVRRVAVAFDLVGSNRSGNENFLVGLTEALVQAQPSWQFLLIGGIASDELGVASNVEHRSVKAGIVSDLLGGSIATRWGANVFLSTYNSPLNFSKFAVTFVHDVSFVRLPEAFPALLRRRIGWSVRRSLRSSQLVTALTQFGREELAATHPKGVRARLGVVPAGISPSDWTPRGLEGRDSFALFVGNLQPRKNLGRVVSAARQAGVPLVVAGATTWMGQEQLAHLTSDGVTYVGRPSDEELRKLYSSCRMLVYPSLYEGFGLPVLEAMASGTPVIASDGSCFPEVTGGAAVLVDAFSTEHIAAAMSLLAVDDAEWLRLHYEGLVRARDFTWAASAARLTAYIEEALCE